MSTQPATQQPQQVQFLIIKGAELQQLQGIVDNIPTKYGRVLDAFFVGVQKRRKEEAEAAVASKSKAPASAEKKTVPALENKASETATGIKSKASDVEDRDEE